MGTRFPILTRLQIINNGGWQPLGSLEPSIPMQDLLQNLHHWWTAIQANLKDVADMKMRKECMQLAYEVEDLLDSCEYELLRNQIEKKEEVDILTPLLLVELFRGKAMCLVQLVTEKTTQIEKHKEEAPELEGKGGKKLKTDPDVWTVEMKPHFKFCTVFPKGQSILKEKLVLLWMAHHLIQPPEGNQDEQPEDAGMGYIDELLNDKLFKHPTKMDANVTRIEDKERIVMNDFMYDLAVEASEEEAQSVQGWQTCSADALHVLVAGAQEFRAADHVRKSRSIRTLRIDGQTSTSSFHSCNQFENLRVLDITGKVNVTDVRTTKLELKHLRYLELSSIGLEEFPNVCDLYNLQTLNLNDNKIRQVPDKISFLEKLRHLFLRETEVEKLPSSLCELCDLRTLDLKYSQISELPSGISKLTKLQCLNVYPLAKRRGNNECATIAHLTSLVGLKGEVEIKGLSTISSAEEVKEANLTNMTGIYSLTLNWDAKGEKEEFISPNEEEEILEGLKPHNHLKELDLEKYDGLVLPKWLGGPPSLEKLTVVSLFKCERCTSLSPLERLPSLKELYVQDMPMLKSLIAMESSTSDPEIYSGNENCGLGTSPADSRQHQPPPPFPSLHYLHITECPEFSSVNAALPSLSSLSLCDSDCLTSISLCKLPALEDLSLSYCPRLVFIEMLQHRQRGWESSNSTCTTSGSGNINYFASRLKKLDITHCPFAMFSSPSMHEFPSAVEQINIYGCPFLKAWCRLHEVEFTNKEIYDI